MARISRVLLHVWGQVTSVHLSFIYNYCMERKFGAISSSADGEKIAARVTGAIIAVSGIVVFLLAQLLGVTISSEQIALLAQQVGDLVGLAMTAYGIGHSVFGFIRALLVNKVAPTE